MKRRMQEPKPEDLADVFRQLQTGRLDALQDLKQLHIAHLALMEHEALRLERKLGRDHPRTAQVLSRIEHGRNLIQKLESETESARIQPVEIGKDEAVLEGRFTDETRRGFSGLRVSIEDQKGQLRADLGQVETDSTGYFALKFNRDILEEHPELESQGVFVVVRTPGGELVHRTDKPLTLTHGSRVKLVRAISRREVARQPSRQPSTPRSPRENKPWVVRGRVIDVNDKPVAGVLVRLFDKDHKYDDLLEGATTNRKGIFRLSYRSQDFKDFAEEQPDLYLIVTDQEGNILFTSEEAVRVNAGEVEEFDIKLTQELGDKPKKD
jgi:hypothetical protein